MLARTDPRLLILLGALLFSTGGAAIKGTSLDGWQVACLRSGIAFFALLALVPAARRGWTPRVALVAVSYAATLVLFVLATKLTTAANAIFLQSTAPLYLLVLGPLLLRERLHWRDAWFIAALALGLALFFLSVDPPTRTAPDPLTGNVLGAITGVTWALTILGLRSLARERGSDAAAASAALGNLFAFAACAYWAFPLGPAGTADWLAVLYLGVFQIGVAYTLVTAAMPRITALEASLLILVEPVLNPLWAWLLHAERPGTLAILGGALILCATGVRTVRQRRMPPA